MIQESGCPLQISQRLRIDPHQLHLTVKDMQGDLKTMNAVMEGNNKIMGRLELIVGRHENHLLDGAK